MSRSDQRNILLVLIFFVFIALLNLSRVLLAEHNHDEDQFIASAILLIKKGLLPYRDYPYFHTPILMYVYAFFFKLFGYPFLTARLITGIFSTLTAGLIFAAIYLFTLDAGEPSVWLPMGWTLIFEVNPVVSYAASKTWNHALSGLLATGAFIALHISLYAVQHKGMWMILCGILIGAAAGTRATLILVAIPLLMAIFLQRSPAGSKLKFFQAFQFLAGFVAGSLPVILLFLIAPEPFLFGNIKYAQLNTLYRIDTQFIGPLTLYEKMKYLFGIIIAEPGNLILILIVLFFGITLSVFGGKIQEAFKKPARLLAGCLIFALAGSLLPTPSWYQYFYAPVPFMVLLGAYSMVQSFRINSDQKRWGALLLGSFTIAGSFFAWNEIGRILEITDLANWRPLQAHVVAHKLLQTIDDGKVLTLAPLYPLEAGLDIYPALATGPFAWRTAYLLKGVEREKYGFLSEDNLKVWLQQDPPSAILVGLEPELEAPLIANAKENDYKFLYFTDELHLWIKDVQPQK